MEAALAPVCLAGGGEGAGPGLPVPGGHAAAHVARALGEAVQLQLYLYLPQSRLHHQQQIENDATNPLKAKSNSLRMHVRMHLIDFKAIGNVLKVVLTWCMGWCWAGSGQEAWMQ